jgi:hypothetical protein
VENAYVSHIALVCHAWRWHHPAANAATDEEGGKQYQQETPS